MWIDTHCHLDAPEFAADRDEVVAAARRVGVGQIVVPAVSEATFADALTMRDRYGCFPAFGLHPIYTAVHQDAHLLTLQHYLQQHQPVAVGEIGLDFYLPSLDSNRQVEIFEAQLKLARDFDLPVLLHLRRAQDQVLKYLRKWRVKGGIAHAFNGSVQQADVFISLGFKLGFGGAMTYSGSQRIRKLARDLPLEALVMETDAPDIPPAWLDHQRNQPAELVKMAEVLAELRGISLAELAAATSANARAILPGLLSG
ncbi:TatD family hydrolase [Iodobacter sp. CM08]|uniref:TatD family hydrolase n=1 Tax=Iodobacter sp. CM08 TaxID=3085902 RepID=UPI002982AAB9|nr:TatD family hydrolase [Iodobacter sp. CM08]MDW5416719.1 TatD family hydrolase [Iodobacter sp. CM08]